MEISICLFFVYVMEAVIFLYYCNNLFQLRHSKTCSLLVVTGAYILLFLFSFANELWLNIFCFLIINSLLFLLLSYSRWTICIFHSALLTCIMSLSELIIIYAISLFAADYYQDSFPFRKIVILSVFSKLLYFLIILLIAKFLTRNRKSHLFSDNIFKLLVLVTIFSTFIMITLFSIWRYSSTTMVENYMIAASSLLLLCMNLCIYWIYDLTQYKNYEFTKLQLQLQKEQDVSEYNQLLLERDESQRILIHDIKKHLQSIVILNKQKENNLVSDYIDKLIHSSDLQSANSVCSNPFLNSILCRYIRQCNNQNIHFKTDIRTNSIDFLSDNDITSLFCNLLDNAMESAAACDAPYIELTTSAKTEPALHIITLINSCAIDPFKDNTSFPLTSKKDKMHHGIGLKSVQRIVKSYHGDMQLYYDQETKTFHTVIAIPASVPSK